MEFNVAERESRVWERRLKQREGVERWRGRTAAERSGESEEKKSLKAEREAESGGKRRRRSAAEVTAAR